MTRSRSKPEFYQQASLSQKLADSIPGFSDYAGSDPEISLSIAYLKVLVKHKMIDPNKPGWKLVIDLLNEQRKAKFATSEKVNEITKMGMMMPRGEDIISDFEEES